MKFFSIQYILTTLEVIQLCNGARILSIYLLPVRSHFILINELIKELAHKGHHTDIISMHSLTKEKIPNYKQILKLSNPFPEINDTIAFMKDFNQYPEQMFSIGNMLCEDIFKNPEFMKIIKDPSKERPYDMIILHAMNTHCLIIAGHIWKIPVVVVSTTSLYPWMHDMVGNPENIAFSSNNMLSVLEDHSFYSRFVNFYYFYRLKFNYLYHALDQDKILKKYFGSNAPTLKELDQSVSLMLVNTYFSMNGAKSKATSVIEIGGLQIRNQDTTLNNSLDKWLDESKDGFIYFTLGSIFRIEKLPPETLNAIFKTLEKMAPTRILVKMMTPEDLPFELPQNFKSLEWIPQEKVLQHPNIKVFITHGGLLGTQESIYYGVPMLCIPFFADQSTNAYSYVRQNIATMIDILSLSEENFEHAINEVLNNPIYRDNIKALSKLFRDRPQSAMDTAIFWVEYVLRNGKDSLRSTAMDLKWWQIALLDIYAVIILGFLIILFILKLFVKMIWKLVYFRKNNTVPKEKKRN